MGLNLKDHFYNQPHLNTLGSIVFSKALAADLKEKYNLQSHKNDDSLYEYWEAPLELFVREIPEQQPNIDKCLAVISELDMDSIVFINDEFSIYYDDVSEAFEKRSIDFENLKSSGIVAIDSSGQPVSYQVPEEKDTELSVIMNDENSSITLSYKGKEIMSFDDEEEIGTLELCVIVLNDNQVVNVIKYMKT